VQTIVEETARVATGSIWVTISVTIWVIGDVDLIAAGSNGVSTVDPALRPIDRTAEGNSAS